MQEGARHDAVPSLICRPHAWHPPTGRARHRRRAAGNGPARELAGTDLLAVSIYYVCADSSRLPKSTRLPALMTDTTPHDVTVLLADLSAGVAGAADRLVVAVMDELRRMAEQAMRREADGHTLQPTELVDAAMMRLLGRTQVEWVSRSQFFAVASQTIRRILVEHARHRRRIKRDHGIRVTLKEDHAEAPGRSLDLIALDEALQQLDALAPRQARVVELRFFGGLDIEETATALDISPATVKRDWTFARAFLLKSLGPI